MKNNSDGMSTGAALLLTLGIMLFIGWIISLTELKCSMSGCDEDAREDSIYCYLHGGSYEKYGNPDYNAVYQESLRRRESYSSESSSSSSEAKNSSNDTASETTKRSSSSRSSSSSSKKSNPYDSYDEGYEAVYEDDDYDWDRYWSDSDYADGVDDAMEDAEW